MSKSKPRKPLIIVFVGEKLAGKEVASHYLTRRHGFVGYRFSKILVDILARLKLPTTRLNEVNLVGGLRERFGGAVLAEVIKAEIVERGERRVVIDGMRHPAELEVLKGLPGFLLVYLTAPLELRFRRARARGEKVGERNFTVTEFKREENWPTEVFIRALGRKAKVRLTNSGTLPELYKQIEEKIVKVYL